MLFVLSKPTFRIDSGGTEKCRMSQWYFSCLSAWWPSFGFPMWIQSTRGNIIYFGLFNCVGQLSWFHRLWYAIRTSKKKSTYFYVWFVFIASKVKIALILCLVELAAKMSKICRCACASLVLLCVALHKHLLFFSKLPNIAWKPTTTKTLFYMVAHMAVFWQHIWLANILTFTHLQWFEILSQV